MTLAPAPLSPLRVLHLITWLNHGGIESWLLNMVRSIPRSVCAMDFCCKGPAVGLHADVARAAGAQVWHCPLRPTLIGFLRGLRRILTAERYDLLHVHLDAHNGLPVYVARALGLPVIATFHNTSFPPMTGWLKLPVIRTMRALYAGVSLRYTLRHANRITGVSQGVLDALYAGQELPVAADSRVLYLGVPPPPTISAAERVELRRTLGIAPTGRVVVHVGSLVAAKNHLGLLQAFELLADAIPDSHLLVVGDGPLRNALRQQVAVSPVAGRIHLLGLRSDVSILLQASDLFLFPSRHEGFGLVLTEAQAVGLPIVASRIPGITEAVADNVSALLHDPDDVAGMAASATALLRSPERARALAAAGRHRYQNLFTLEAAAERLLGMYTDMLRETMPSSGRESAAY